MKDDEKQKRTNLGDVLIHLLNCILNLLKFEKIACLVIAYLLYRDAVLLGKLDENVNVSELMIDAKIISTILSNDNILIVILACVIVVLFFALIVMCTWVVPMYKKEIERLASVRKELMHGEDLKKLKDHHSSLLV